MTLKYNDFGYLRVSLFRGIDEPYKGSVLISQRDEKLISFDDAEALLKGINLLLNNHDYPFEEDWEYQERHFNSLGG